MSSFLSVFPYQTQPCDDQTSVEVFGRIIHAPVTAGTDLLITVTCWSIFFISRKQLQTTFLNQHYRLFFFIMGLATMLGGVFGHAMCNLGVHWKLPGWICSMLAVMLVERSAILHAADVLSKKLLRFFIVMNIIEICLMIFLSVYSLNFFFVEFHACYGFIIVFGSFETYRFLRTGSQASKRLLYGVAIAVLAAVIHIAELSVSAWFTHADIAHILMCIAACVWYLAIRKMPEEEHIPVRA